MSDTHQEHELERPSDNNDDECLNASLISDKEV